MLATMLVLLLRRAFAVAFAFYDVHLFPFMNCFPINISRYFYEFHVLSKQRMVTIPLDNGHLIYPNGHCSPHVFQSSVSGNTSQGTEIFLSLEKVNS